MFNQRLSIILCLSIILTSVHSKTYKYVCADKLKQGGVCFLESKDPTTKEATAYVKKCGKGETCKPANADALGGCYKDEINKLGDEDKECEVNEECISQNCVSGKCKYADDGAECKREDECKPSSYCLNGKCKAISKAGEQCDENERESCMKGYICGKSGTDTESKCIELYSVEDGTVVSDQSLCKSGQINIADKKCITYTLTSKDCDSSGECSYTTKDGKIETFDFCDTKSDGKAKACRELNGDLWDKYIEVYKKRLNKIKDDKDFNRLSSNWNRYLGDRNVSDAYLEWRYNVLFSDASDCVKDFIKQQEGVSSSSNFVVFNLMIIITFALILI